MRQTLPAAPGYHRVLRAAGILTWVFLGLPILDSSTRSGESLTGGRWVAWLVLFLVFGPTFWFSSSPEKRAPAMRLGALLVETIAALGMTALHRDCRVRPTRRRVIGDLLMTQPYPLIGTLPTRTRESVCR
jgi:hypothetical protein